MLAIPTLQALLLTALRVTTVEDAGLLRHHQPLRVSSLCPFPRRCSLSYLPPPRVAPPPHNAGALDMGVVHTRLREAAVAKPGLNPELLIALVERGQQRYGKLGGTPRPGRGGGR